MVRGMDFFKVHPKYKDGISLADHKELHAPAGKFLRHAIFGMNDGLVSVLALTAGLTGALLSKNIVIIAGVTEMIAGAISMSLGTYISTKSQIEFYKREVKREKEDMERLPTLEKSHVKEIYQGKGFRGAELEKVVNKLTSNKKIWLDVLVNEELGLSSSKMENAFSAGVVMFFSFIFGALIPLSSFFLLPTGFALKAAVISSLAVLFLAGAGKTHFTGGNWIKSGFEMVVIGALATTAAYYAGHIISGIVAYLV